MHTVNKSLIIPCKDEGQNFIGILKRFEENIKLDTEILIVLDSTEDLTYELIKKAETNAKILINPKKGVASAVNHGVNQSKADFICVAMGDGSDDPTQVEELFMLVERGLSVAVASRYSRGGQFIGEKNIKYLLSKYSGKILNMIFSINTKDPTNMFKAYDKTFIKEVGIESDNGFTLGLEMIVKAKLRKKKIGEIPTIWIDRNFGESKFDFNKFLPSYVYWVGRLILRRK
jgi:dolichol-phosphate mannosyltransferase|tara:strand:+ start:24815 stop:25507 length:693 start_codon:yes stop_codon:yes gene_type:complete